MAKVFAPPETVGKPPAFDYKQPYEVHRQKEEKYIQSVCRWAKTNGSGPNRGEIIRFQVADGYALYVVYAPSALLHLAVGDAWHFHYVKSLSAKDIAEEVRRAKALDELFKKERKSA